MNDRNNRDRVWISISREYGSGGLLIGEMLSERLGIPCHDQDLLEKGAKISDIDMALSDRGLAKVANRWLYENLSYDAESDFVGKSPQEILRASIEKAIVSSAAEGDGIFMGRASEIVLRHHFGINPIRIFIYAPYENRLENVIYRDLLSKEDAEAKIAEIDHLRSQYYEFCKEDEFSMWGRKKDYDAVFNSGTLSKETIVNAIAEMYYDRR